MKNEKFIKSILFMVPLHRAKFCDHEYVFCGCGFVLKWVLFVNVMICKELSDYL